MGLFWQNFRIVHKQNRNKPRPAFGCLAKIVLQGRNKIEINRGQQLAARQTKIEINRGQHLAARTMLQFSYVKNISCWRTFWATTL